MWGWWTGVIAGVVALVFGIAFLTLIWWATYRARQLDDPTHPYLPPLHINQLRRTHVKTYGDIPAGVVDAIVQISIENYDREFSPQEIGIIADRVKQRLYNILAPGDTVQFVTVIENATGEVVTILSEEGF